MNTARKNFYPFLDPEEDYVILLHDLEFGMSKRQLRRITDKWNNGMCWEEIADEEERNHWEVLIALAHQVKSGKRLRPFAYRMKEGDEDKTPTGFI